MKFIKHYSVILFISFLLFLIIINIFKPIFTAPELIFPYSITKFDIVSKFPKYWFYIKLAYCISCFFNLFLATNSIFKFIEIKKSKHKHIKKDIPEISSGEFSLYLGTNSENKSDVFIPEKGLYQNILVTGTIGSRKNRFLYVSLSKSINSKY